MKNITDYKLVKHITNPKTDLNKRFKYYIIAPAVLLVLAFVLMFTIGFNRSVEFTGGTAVRVFLQEDSTYTETVNKIDQVLSDNGLVASTNQEAEFEGNTYVIVKYKIDNKLTEAQNNDLNNKVVDDLFVKFNFDKNDLEQEFYIVGNEKFDSSVGRQAMINTFGILVLASVLVVVYFIIRFGHQSAMTALLSMYHDVLMALSLSLIFRVEVNLTFMAGILFVLAFSALNNLLYFSKIKENVKLMEKTTHPKEVALDSLKSHFGIQKMLLASGFVVLAVLIAFGWTSTLSASLLSIFGLVASFYSLTFLVPTLWTAIFVPSKKALASKLEAEQVEQVQLPEIDNWLIKSYLLKFWGNIFVCFAKLCFSTIGS